MPSLFELALACIETSEPDAKLEQTARLAAQWASGRLGLDRDGGPKPIDAPGRPDRPLLVPPEQVPRRGYRTAEQRAALIHALAHIEFNAINLAWDAVYRFRAMPRAFYRDWIAVATDEARHFALLRGRLRAYGLDYGAFHAHNGLWEMAVRTAHSLVDRMAMVPRALEARSLDVTPGIRRRLSDAGDPQTAAVVAVIERDEVGHVLAGSRWFRHGCRARGLDPDATFVGLFARYMKSGPKPPFARTARIRAGFSEAELLGLERLEDRRE
jgi:uncharacterized ferritin-like protein (DUF455 family)